VIKKSETYDVLPYIIACIIKFPPTNLLANLLFISRFCELVEVAEIAAYGLFQQAVFFLDTFASRNLDIEQKEFERLLKISTYEQNKAKLPKFGKALFEAFVEH